MQKKTEAKRLTTRQAERMRARERVTRKGGVESRGRCCSEAFRLGKKPVRRPHFRCPAQQSRHGSDHPIIRPHGSTRCSCRVRQISPVCSKSSRVCRAVIQERRKTACIGDDAKASLGNRSFHYYSDQQASCLFSSVCLPSLLFYSPQVTSSDHGDYRRTPTAPSRAPVRHSLADL